MMSISSAHWSSLVGPWLIDGAVCLLLMRQGNFWRRHVRSSRPSFFFFSGTLDLTGIQSVVYLVVDPRVFLTVLDYWYIIRNPVLCTYGAWVVRRF